MTDMKDAKGSKTRMGNGAKIETKAIGKLPFRTNDGTKGVMNDVHLIPGAAFNLVSGTKLLTLGFKSQGDKDKMVYSKGNTKLVFDIKIRSPQGMLLAARLNRTATEVGGAAEMTRVQPVKTV